MIDAERRKKLAFYLRQFSNGRTSNDEFEISIADEVTNGWLPEQYYRAKEIAADDPIIRPMLEQCWGLYDDTRSHHLKGSDRLSNKGLREIARWILFLHSDLEYLWPYFDTGNPLLKFSFKQLVISFFTLGQYYRDRRKEQKRAFIEFQQLGNFAIWPFFRTEDYNAQLKKPPFLKGRPEALVLE